MRKFKLTYISLTVFVSFLISTHLFCWTEKEAKKAIDEADKIVTNYENKNIKYLKYIPHDTYGDAIINIVTAKNLFSQKSYNNAYFLAKISIIKLDTAAIIAQKRFINIDYQRLLLSYDDNNKKKNQDKINALNRNKSEMQKLLNLYNVLLKEGYKIKGQSLVCDFKNEEIFSSYNFILTTAIERLGSIDRIMKLYPNSFITIVAHSSRFDYSNKTLRSAVTIKNHLTGLGIKSHRITAVGLGNTEVTPTGFGYRRVNRIEIIINGIPVIKDK